jgi:uncharacterized protein (TIGR02996 family)
MLDELRRAIEEAAWPRALVLAIEAWRASRAPVLADLVDRIVTRLPAEGVPREGVQRWWMQQARTYDPARATVLLASCAELALKSGVEKKLIDRLPVLEAWPDDPRVACVLASWFADANVGWRYAHEAETVVFYDRIADQLARLRDVRAIPVLERVLAEPRGLTVGLREQQHELATRLIVLLADAALHAPPANAGEIARWCPSPAPPPTSLDERTLWREAATSDDARLVLADFLLERGDRRGEIITLASAGTDDNARAASALLHEHWERWMGDLAIVLDRGNCSFVGGLLEIASVGMYSTPEWAYPKAAAHRELSTIRVVRPGWHASNKGYVAFLHALAYLPPRIRLDASMVEPFALARPRWPVRHLELVTNAPDLPHVLRLAASAMPDVEAIDIPLQSDIDRAMIAMIPALPRHFAKLVRVHVDASRWLASDIRAELTELEALPFVEIDHGINR